MLKYLKVHLVILKWFSKKMGVHTRVEDGEWERGLGRKDLDEGYEEFHFTAFQISESLNIAKIKSWRIKRKPESTAKMDLVHRGVCPSRSLKSHLNYNRFPDTNPKSSSRKGKKTKGRRREPSTILCTKKFLLCQIQKPESSELVLFGSYKCATGYLLLERLFLKENSILYYWNILQLGRR